MRICRFDNDRLGLVEGDQVLDVSSALEVLPIMRWPLPLGDLLIRYLPEVCSRISRLKSSARRIAVNDVKLLSPVANPSKIINAPINYAAHVDEAKLDTGIAHGRNVQHISDWGLFLKANSALIGAGSQIQLRWPDRRNDHEIELAVVIGKECSHVRRQDALKCIAGYSIGLDMTLRGPEYPSFRKSIDTYAVCGPWLVTADEVADPNALELCLKVNGSVRQSASTRELVYDVERLVEYASSFYTLYPGDIIFTGTPAGVGPVSPGDTISASIENIGQFDIRVAPEYLQPGA